MGKKPKKTRPETFSDTFRVNYLKETEAFVTDAFSFLVSEYGFECPKIEHEALLSEFTYCSEGIDIKIYYEWRDSFLDGKVTKNGITKRFPLILPAGEDQPQYWTKERPTNDEELFGGILLVRDALVKCMPYILSTDFSSMSGENTYR